MAKAIMIQPPTPVTLLEMAIQKGVGMDQLKELMDLQERWEKKEARKSFFDAMSKFQSMVPVLKKSKTAKINSQKGAFSYKHSDLGSITAGIKHCLNECGLSYRWEFAEENTKMKVTCYISHRDGHTETTSMEAGLDNSGFKNDIQQKGSTNTYLQRYTLIGALGLSTADEDNDGAGRSNQNNAELSEDEVLEQWKTAIDATATQIELTRLYMKNKKTVDADPKVQALFKTQETKLKNVPSTNLNMP